MSVRKLFFWCHLTAGCAAGLVIFIMSATGVLLAFERQILAWGDARFVANLQTGSAVQMPLDAIARSVDPESQAPRSITIRARRAAPVELSFGRERTVFIDPSDGRVIGEAPAALRAFFGTTERIHRTLGGELRGGPGRRLTGACNLAFLFLVLSGLYLWLPKKYTLQHLKPAIWFRQGLQARARDLNWHKVIGVWCGLPLFFIVLSGVIMSYGWANNLLYQLTGTTPPAAAGPEGREGARNRGRQFGEAGRRREGGSPRNVKSVDELAGIVRQSVPDWKSITFRVPEARDRAITFSVDKAYGGRPQTRLQLTLNRTSGEIQRQEGFENYNLGRKLRTIARFLHTGEILGFGGQVVAMIASLGGAFLVYTGLALAIRRLFRWQKRRNQTAQQQSEAVELSRS